MDFKLEKKLRELGYKIIIGVDEAGRGPLAGPVVACAATVRNDKFLISNDKNWDLIKDSKMLSVKQREKLFDFIHENFYVGVGMRNHKTIDRINILQATYLAAKKAIEDLLKKINQETRNKNQTKSQIPNPKSKIQNFKTIIIFDGNKIIPGLNIEQIAIIGGDKSVKSISAASIIAKVTRDRLMLKMQRKYPGYSFAQHKGYGTKLHLEQLKKFGPSPIHRLSFRPVKECVFLPKRAFDVKFIREK